MATIRAKTKKGRLYVEFAYAGRRRSEPTAYYCSKGSNCRCREHKLARALADEIQRKISERSFEYEKYFPRSRNTRSRMPENEVTFYEYCQKWMAYKAAVLSPNTLKGYHVCLNRLKDFHDTEIAQISRIMIRDFITRSQVSPKSIHNTIGFLSSVLSMAVEDSIIAVNPCENLQLPKVIKRRPDPFTAEEVKLIIEWIGKRKPHMAAFFTVAFFTGARTGEVIGMQWGDIDFNRSTITFRRSVTNGAVKIGLKSQQERTVSMLPSVAKALKKQQQFTFLKSDWVFLAQQTGTHYAHSGNIRGTIWYPCLKALGFRKRELYQTRHTFACLAIQAGEDLGWIRDMLGHADMKQLFERYGNWTRSQNNGHGSHLEQMGKNAPEIRQISLA